MYKKVKELADKAELPFQDEYGDHYHRLVDLVIEECINVLETDFSIKHCAYTTHDIGIVECTLDKVEKAIKNRFKE